MIEHPTTPPWRAARHRPSSLACVPRLRGCRVREWVGARLCMGVRIDIDVDVDRYAASTTTTTSSSTSTTTGGGSLRYT